MPSGLTAGEGSLNSRIQVFDINWNAALTQNTQMPQPLPDPEQCPRRDHSPHCKKIDRPRSGDGDRRPIQNGRRDHSMRPSAAKKRYSRNRHQRRKPNRKPRPGIPQASRPQHQSSKDRDERAFNQAVDDAQRGRLGNLDSARPESFEKLRSSSAHLLLSSNWRRRSSSSASMLVSSRTFSTSCSLELPKNRLTRCRTSNRVASFRSTSGR